MFDVRRATVFCLGNRFSQHTMNRYTKHWGEHDSLATRMV